MAEAKHTKRKIRVYAEEHGVSYVAARRALTGEPAVPETPLRAEVPCDLVNPFCYALGGRNHPGRTCWRWEHLDDWELRATVSYDTRSSADLVRGRAHAVYYRTSKTFEPATRVYGSSLGRAEWVLGLVYAILLAEQPELDPGWTALWDAVLADDLAAVDALCEPLDRAAMSFLNVDADTWWKGSKLRIDAAVQRVLARVEGTPAKERHWEEVLDVPAARRWAWEQMIWAEAERWGKAFALDHVDSDGFPQYNSVAWLDPGQRIDAFLVQRYDGYPKYTRVQLADGQVGLVFGAQWRESGAPKAYVLHIETGQSDYRGRPTYLKGVRTVAPNTIVGPAPEPAPAAAEPAVDQTRPRTQQSGPARYVVGFDDYLGHCDDCSCCSAERCNRGPDSGCPTDSLGDSICPCTGGY